jgi:hypothetical protein
MSVNGVAVVVVVGAVSDPSNPRRMAEEDTAGSQGARGADRGRTDYRLAILRSNTTTRVCPPLYPPTAGTYITSTPPNQQTKYKYQEQDAP